MNTLKPLNAMAALQLQPLAAKQSQPATAQASQDAAATQQSEDPKQLKHAAEQFESMFIKQMLREMNNATREMSAKDSPLRDSISNDMLDYANTFVSDALASQHAFGISDFIVRQMTPGASRLNGSLPSGMTPSKTSAKSEDTKA
ncbi:flagellar biosynthesis protein FlgJ [Trinickia sp. YCB016]